MLKRNISLPNGLVLELEYDERFYEKVREALGLGPRDVPTDEQVRYFVHEVCKVAFDKAEAEMKNDGTWED